MSLHLKVFCVLVLGLVAAAPSTTPLVRADDESPTEKKAPGWVFNKKLRDVTGKPAGWTTLPGAPSMLVRDGALVPTKAGNVYNVLTIPAVIGAEDDFALQITWRGPYHAPLIRGRPGMGNLAVHLVGATAKGRATTLTRGALTFHQDVSNSPFRTQNGFVTLTPADGGEAVSTPAVRKLGEGHPHTALIERRGKQFLVTVDDVTVYAGDLGCDPAQALTGFRLAVSGQIGGDSDDPLVTRIEAVELDRPETAKDKPAKSKD